MNGIESGYTILKRILNFLGTTNIPNIYDFEEYLDCSKAKINNKQLYYSIPNIEEINNALGNNKSGWLL